MNSLVTTLTRDVTCAAAAAVISLVMTAAFVQSTSQQPFTHAAAPRVAMQAEHAWFGQPEPAVLVD
ncbi:MAG: hypothetical protein JOZ67_02035 [Gammaproteobacteria bacterium]|nr:hypothetical protein [Gammaproteobacteria bacterium]MBV9695359.1 hypothetical protein [Gammaproteobacteria bacterium]